MGTAERATIQRHGPLAQHESGWTELPDLLELETLQFENCKNKGFDAIQPDGTDEAEGHGVSFDGVPLTVGEVNAYLIRLASIAHSVGLSIGQLDYLDQTTALEPYFDFAIVESCFPAGVCG